MGQKSPGGWKDGWVLTEAYYGSLFLRNNNMGGLFKTISCSLGWAQVEESKAGRRREHMLRPSSVLVLRHVMLCMWQFIGI